MVPEDSQFAGERLAYPVPAELVYRAVLAYLVQSTPAASYIWANLVWLIAVCGFAVAIVAELGGGYVAQLCATPWLLFGINPLGYLIRRFIVGGSAYEHSAVWGDLRWTSWLLKYVELNTMPVVLGMFIALAYLLLRFWSRDLSWDLLLLFTLLLSSIGMLYPILFPPGCALIFAAVLVNSYQAWEKREGLPWKLNVAMTAVLLIAALVTFAHLAFLVNGRKMAGGAVHLSDFRHIGLKIIALLVVITPLLVGVALVWRRCWQEKPTATFFLLLSALASAALYPAFYLPYWNNEYKYLFTAVICLAPFAALATGRVWERLRVAASVPVMAITFAFLVMPYISEIMHWKDFPKRDHPIVDTSGFYMRLDNRELLAGVCDAIRTKTPIESVLVVQKPELHFPTVTDRSLYVAPEQNFPFAGVNQLPDVLLLGIRGYPEKEVNARRTAVSQLFTGDIRERENSLNRILQLRRPVAILTEPGDRSLASWLQAAGKGRAVYAEDGRAVWLVLPTAQQKN